MTGMQRRREKGGRPWRVEVRVSDSERSALRVRAAERGLSVGGLLVSAGLGEVPSGVSRGVLLGELMAVRRGLHLVVGGWAEPPSVEVLARIEVLCGEVDRVLGAQS